MHVEIEDRRTRLFVFVLVSLVANKKAMQRRAVNILAAACCLALVGCAAEPRFPLEAAFYTGQFGDARVYLEKHLPARKADSKGYDRNYLLQRMRLMVATLADGYALESDPNVDEVFDVLATQGINEDKTVASVVLNEDLKVWKGEPFEQALALHYVGLNWAMQGSWDNARAAVSRSLFHLRDFSAGVGKDKRLINTRDLIERAYTAEHSGSAAAKKDDYLDHGYVSVESDFALGYLMTAIANHQMAIATGDTNRLNEAMDNYHRVVSLKPQLAPLVEALKDPRGYNTILVVDFGKGPQKIGTGPDQAIATFEPVTYSDSRGLVVSAGGAARSFRDVCDVNQMARDHRWNNLEDVRLAKSYVGSALVGAGAVTTAYGLDRGNKTAALVGLGMLLAGAVAKAGAHADTRYCELIPQRVYVVPVMVSGRDAQVTLEVEGIPQSRFVLTGLAAPSPGGPAQLRYVRLVTPSPQWATSGNLYYATDEVPDVRVAANYPYLLGGASVREPTQAVLDSYHKSGYLTDMALQDLAELYRAEDIQFDPRADEGRLNKHVLEGGRSMVVPLAGTSGFARLFGQVHPPYKPKSEEVRAAAARVAPSTAPGLAGGPTPR
jgi:hypothetical protein